MVTVMVNLRGVRSAYDNAGCLLETPQFARGPLTSPTPAHGAPNGE